MMQPTNSSNPAMIPWKSYVQYAALRSRSLIKQRQQLAVFDEEVADDDDIVTLIDDRPCLLLHFSNETVYVWFNHQGSWKIGRSSDCDIVLPDQCVSRYHATIQMIALDEFYLVDLNSCNGSFINGRRVREISRLHSGDRISLGQVEIEFYGDTSEPLRMAMNEAVTVELA